MGGGSRDSIMLTKIKTLAAAAIHQALRAQPRGLWSRPPMDSRPTEGAAGRAGKQPGPV